jgi:hypothetical protein
MLIVAEIDIPEQIVTKKCYRDFLVLNTILLGNCYVRAACIYLFIYRLCICVYCPSEWLIQQIADCPSVSVARPTRLSSPLLCGNLFRWADYA